MFRPFSLKNLSPSDISLQLLHSEVLKAPSTSPQTDIDLAPHFPHLTPGWICWPPLKACAPTYELTPKQSTSKLWHDHHIPFSLSALIYVALLNSWRTSIPTGLSLPHLLAHLFPSSPGDGWQMPTWGCKALSITSYFPSILTPKHFSDRWHELPLQ